MQGMKTQTIFKLSSRFLRGKTGFRSISGSLVTFDQRDKKTELQSLTAFAQLFFVFRNISHVVNFYTSDFLFFHSRRKHQSEVANI